MVDVAASRLNHLEDRVEFKALVRMSSVGRTMKRLKLALGELSGKKRGEPEQADEAAMRYIARKRPVSGEIAP